MATYSAEYFAKSLGGLPEDWGLRAGDVVEVDVYGHARSDRGDHGHLNDVEIARLEGTKEPPGSFDRDLVVAYINRHRRSFGQPPLDPTGAGWTDEDVIEESRRISRLPNMEVGWAPGLSPLAAFGGAAIGGELATRASRSIVGTDTDALAASLGSRIAGQLVGGVSLAAAVAPEGLRVRAALGAAAGAWVPYLGLPLGALGTYVATRRRPNPVVQTRTWWIAGIVAATVAAGALAYRMLRTSESGGVLTPAEGVARALEILGEGAEVIEIADVAYTMVYPDCPPLLDPEDPTHEECIAAWLQLRDLAIDQLPAPAGRPSKTQEGLASTGPAADLRGWLESLTSTQRSELRTIIGSTYYDPMKRSAYEGDDGGVVRAVLRFKASAEAYASKDKMGALARYMELTDLLGPKLDELMRLAKSYKGKA